MSPAHARARACSVSLPGLSGRPEALRSPGVVCAGLRDYSEPNSSRAAMGEARTTSDLRLEGEPLGASSFGPRGPSAGIGSHARAEPGSASPPRGRRKQRLLAAGRPTPPKLQATQARARARPPRLSRRRPLPKTGRRAG